MTSSIKRPIPYELLQGPGPHHFKFESGIFVVLTDSQSIGFFVDDSSYSEDKVSSTLQNIQGASPKTIQEIKIIGSLELIQKLSPFFKKYGPVKTVPKEGCHEVLFYPKENRTRLAAIPSNNTKESSLGVGAKSVSADKLVGSSKKEKIKVLIVDDSKTIRMLLKKIFAQSDRIEIVADTGEPLEVLQLISEKRPDVITLDIHMPKMDGLTLLTKYIPQYPIPTVMITSISMEEGPTVLNALEAGAVDYIKKPEMNELTEASDLIIDKVISAAASRVTVHRKSQTRVQDLSHLSLDNDAFIAIGASTGGTEALRVLLTQLPPEIPPILIVQHIPAGFSNAFAKRLNSLCPFEVVEAKDQDEIIKNRVLIAPGGKQMRAVCRGRKWFVVIEDTPPVNRHKPSVDHLFNSLTEFEFKKPVGIILTGMGGDGAKGLLNLKNKGWMTIAQNKESCVVFGMPAVAIDLGAAQHVCHLNDIAAKIHQLIPGRKTA